MTRADNKPQAPLSAVVFEILLALAGEERHGYDIMREVERRTGGNLSLYPGTLYRAIGRLVADGLIQELEQRPARRDDDERRRYYRLTPRGRLAAETEARRLAAQVRVARGKNLLKGSSGA
jgi:DNA-binding PadR family transcriptional regulator